MTLCRSESYVVHRTYYSGELSELIYFNVVLKLEHSDPYSVLNLGN